MLYIVIRHRVEGYRWGGFLESIVQLDYTVLEDTGCWTEPAPDQLAAAPSTAFVVIRSFRGRCIWSLTTLRSWQVGEAVRPVTEVEEILMRRIESRVASPQEVKALSVLLTI
jgi:hypothetical protein